LWQFVVADSRSVAVLWQTHAVTDVKIEVFRGKAGLLSKFAGAACGVPVLIYRAVDIR
jgi:hypothetical protein